MKVEFEDGSIRLNAVSPEGRMRLEKILAYFVEKGVAKEGEVLTAVTYTVMAQSPSLGAPPVALELIPMEKCTGGS